MAMITLKNKNMEITLSPIGASIYRWRFHNEDMVVTLSDEEEFNQTENYFGKTIGRLCGRIFKDGEVSLHGGQDGISTKIFDYQLECNRVVFSYLSKDGESGYPGNFKLEVIYTLVEDTLTLEFIASVDKLCLVSLTNHTFFCLGESKVQNLKLKMNSDKFIYYDSKLLPIEWKDVPDYWDFHKTREFNMDHEIDNSFSLKDGKIQLSSNKYCLDIETDFKTTQIYTDNFINNVKTLLSRDNHYRGVAIEPQDDQLDRKELLPGQTYQRKIIYRLRKL